eukprot:TRINITY_DN15032_c0_g1_i2.p1 TRINITY_DN15032_c0_g1~~TRINITY_DN15032_c0_g1_i2.p1  ORF type:complete len:334 (-),score=72.27 TRINITY_DN15032_c0_g1_i2:357-1265(-)
MLRSLVGSEMCIRDRPRDRPVSRPNPRHSQVQHTQPSAPPANPNNPRHKQFKQSDSHVSARADNTNGFAPTGLDTSECATEDEWSDGGHSPLTDTQPLLTPVHDALSPRTEEEWSAPSSPVMAEAPFSAVRRFSIEELLQQDMVDVQGCPEPDVVPDEPQFPTDISNLHPSDGEAAGGALHPLSPNLTRDQWSMQPGVLIAETWEEARGGISSSTPATARLPEENQGALTTGQSKMAHVKLVKPRDAWKTPRDQPAEKGDMGQHRMRQPDFNDESQQPVVRAAQIKPRTRIRPGMAEVLVAE